MRDLKDYGAPFSMPDGSFSIYSPFGPVSLDIVSENLQIQFENEGHYEIPLDQFQPDTFAESLLLIRQILTNLIQSESSIVQFQTKLRSKLESKGITVVDQVFIDANAFWYEEDFIFPGVGTAILRAVDQWDSDIPNSYKLYWSEFWQTNDGILNEGHKDIDLIMEIEMKTSSLEVLR